MAQRLSITILLALTLSTPAFAAPKDAVPNLIDSIGDQPFRQWLAGSGLGRMLKRNASDLVVMKGTDGSETVYLGEGFRHVILIQASDKGEPVMSCVSTAAEAEAFLTRRATVEKQP